MRRIQPVPDVPDRLAPEPDAATPLNKLTPGARERRKAITEMTAWIDSGSDPEALPHLTFSAYKHKTVKQALRDAFGPVCAYCEVGYEGPQPMAVEHYRPKAGWMQDFDSKPESVAYYWLASTWSNLLPSCTRCNTTENYDHADGTTSKSGKGTVFPLLDEARRATAPGAENDETPLLLHPYEDEPADHLVFLGDGTVQPAETDEEEAVPRGRSTIDVVGLNRPGLIDARNALLVVIERELDNVERYGNAVKCYPRDADLRAGYEASCAALRELAQDGKPFSTMVKAVVPAQIVEGAVSGPAEK